MEYLGYVGGGLLSAQLVPQIRKTYTLRSAGEISYFFLALNISGLVCMTTYAAWIDEMPIYVPTSISLAMTSMLMGMKVYFDGGGGRMTERMTERMTDVDETTC